MNTDRGKVHQEADNIVGQQEAGELEGIDYVVTICRRELHYVHAIHGGAAITSALDRPPDWEGMEVYVEDDTDEGDGPELAE